MHTMGVMITSGIQVKKGQVTDLSGQLRGCRAGKEG